MQKVPFAVLLVVLLHCAQPVFAQQATSQAQAPQVQAQATQVGATANATGQGCWAEAKCGNWPSAPPQPASLQNAPPQDVKVAVVSMPEETHFNWFNIATIAIAVTTIIFSFAIYIGNMMTLAMC